MRQLPEGHQACDDRRMGETVTVAWEWRPCGLVTLAEGKLVFPRVPNAAGVYRLTFQDDCGQQSGVYVGEADLLPRRFQQYRTPGASQQTNLRLNPVMVSTLATGGRVAIEIAITAHLRSADGSAVPLDLTWKAARVLVERAAEVAERAAGAVVLNK
jgi:hypothetical protein